MSEVIVADLSVVKEGMVAWVVGMGKAPIKDELLEVAFYNAVSGDANNPLHTHVFSTERLLIIEGGMTVEIIDENGKGREINLCPRQMIIIPPGKKHRIVGYNKDTIALNLRNSKEGAVGHLPEDRA